MKIRSSIFYPMVTFAFALAAIFSFSLIPPPAKVHAQLSSPQTWAGSAGGTSTALTVTIHNVVALNDLLGVPIRVLPSGTNNGPSTLQVNIDTGGNLGQITIQRPTSNLGLQGLSGGELQTSQMVEFTFDGSGPTCCFEITSPIDMTPVGQAIEIRGTSAPLGTLFEDGSCVSTSTYAALFSVIGNNYGGGCSGGQFKLPDSRGTLFAAADNQGSHGAAGNITSGGSGCSGTFESVCGSQNQTLTANQIPSITMAVTVTSQNGQTGIPTTTSAANISGAAVAAGSGPVVPASSAASWGAVNSLFGNASSNNTGSQSHPILPPILIGYRAIKY